MAGNVSGLAGELRIEGLVELNRAFKAAGTDLKKELREQIREAGEPVASKAQVLAKANISHIGRSGWWLMRVGATESTVYVAPKQRGHKGRSSLGRPNLKPLLLDKAMIPALESEHNNIVESFNDMLGTIGKDWER